MADWQAVGIDSLKTAQKLLELGKAQDHDTYWRSMVSRAYYAVFAAVTAELRRCKVTFKPGWGGPTHAVVPKLAKSHLTMLSNRTRQDLFRIIRRLYLARIDADYVPGITVDRASALNVYFQALDVFRYLGIKA